MTNKMKNNSWVSDGFEPFDQYQHAQDLEKGDVFNRLTDDSASIHLKSDLLKLAASDHPDAVAALREAGIESPRAPKPFHLSDGSIGKVFADANGTWHAVVTIAGQQLDFSGDDRDGCMIRAEAHMAKNSGPRDLTPSENLRVSRLAQSGETAEAASLYVRLRLDRMEPRSDDEILTDSTLTWLLNDCARFVFQCSRQDFVPDDEFSALLDRAASARPLTVHVIDALYDKFQDQKSEAARSTRRATHADLPESELVPSQEEVTAELESLGDSALETLRTKTLRHRGQLIRRFHQQIVGR